MTRRSKATSCPNFPASPRGSQFPVWTINGKMPFYVLGLSPNAARISIRFWLDTTLGDLAARLTRHYDDMRLEPLAMEDAAQFLAAVDRTRCAAQDARTFRRIWRASSTRAILTGGRYPLSLLTLCLARLRADRDVNGYRAAMIKATLTRLNKEVPVSLDRTELNAGYRLGRLFARVGASTIGRHR